ncbi:MAG TPA: dihydrofolate reductase family protein, partial [Chitinophagaceae bacterium]|nr:dihydrofolate reductase family protein [Chitinophagaceae bacterium]
HEDLETFIISRTDRPSKGHLKFYSGDLKKLITELKNKKGKNIFIDGGAQIVHELLNEKLIDEIILSIIPVLVGDGIPLFKNGRPQQGLKLIHCQSYEKGLIQLYYRCLP